MGVNIELILAKMSDIKQEVMSDSGEEYIEKVRKAAVAPKLTCMGCNGFFRGPVTYCQNKHGLCSICFGDNIECPVTGCTQKAFLTLDFLSELVKELKLPIPCKYKKDGCAQENTDEEIISDHEIECGYRKLPCFGGDCPDQPAMDFVDHLFSAHDEYGKFQENPGKWFIDHSGYAYKMWIDSETGLRFRAGLEHNDEEKRWNCYTMVFGGKNIAKKFRAEMRLSSHDVDTSLIFNCNVFCLDDWTEWDDSKDFYITYGQFKIYNKGHIELGDHKDKNGEVTIPVTVEVKMKKLNLG